MSTLKSEASLHVYTRKLCKECGILFYKFSSPARRGVPDLILINKKGQVVFLELKSPTGRGKLSPLQQNEIKKLRLYNACVYVASTREKIDGIIQALLI